MPFKARSNDQNKLIVVGISKTLDDAGLNDLFGLYGTVADAKVVLDDKKQSRGFGFVTYTSAAAKNKAIKHMNKSTVDGRILNVRDVIPKADREVETKKEEKLKTGICWAFQKGLCEKGDACKYPHEVKDGEYGSCFEFVQSGKCKRGDECKFAHTGKEPKHDMDTSNDGTSTTNESRDESKPRVCFAFQNGKCHRGKSCMFLHEQLEVKESNDPKKRKREEQIVDPATQLKNLIAAEEKAYEAYQAAKKARIVLEREVHGKSKDDIVEVEELKSNKVVKSTKVNNEEIKSTKKSTKQISPVKETKPEKKAKKEIEVTTTKVTEKPTKKTQVIVAHRQKVDEFVDNEDEVRRHDEGDDDDDDEGPPHEPHVILDDEGTESLSSIIQNAVAKMKQDDLAVENDEIEIVPTKQTKTKKKPIDTKPKPLPKKSTYEDVDMGAAFDDNEPPRKKAKGDDRLKASDHRRLRQEKKKQALALLRSKKQIEIDHSIDSK